MPRARTIRRKIGRWWVNVRVKTSDADRAAAILDDVKALAEAHQEIAEDEQRIRDEIEARLILHNIEYERIWLTEARR